MNKFLKFIILLLVIIDIGLSQSIYNVSIIKMKSNDELWETSNFSGYDFVIKFDNT